ncbi:hypothetical protein [Desulfospira joergensenii]|uniref:hypothetical protein n=1 Tax=Desulfospira joergensenii TaxID=53329 RepID=UPI00048272B8|nr:hypothetical protein [Desulfospira joergensenii]
MENLSHLYLTRHKDFIEKIIARYVNAELILVESRSDIGNRIGLSKWGSPGRRDRILFPKTISITEQLSVILAMMKRESSMVHPGLADHANRLFASNSMLFLEHLVLHEIAHIKNKWGQKKETACDLWAFEQIRGR